MESGLPEVRSYRAPSHHDSLHCVFCHAVIPPRVDVRPSGLGLVFGHPVSQCYTSWPRAVARKPGFDRCSNVRPMADGRLSGPVLTLGCPGSADA